MGLFIQNRRSKLEIDLYNNIVKIFDGFEVEHNKTIRTSSGRIIYPDIVIEDLGIIIEFFGDYWHANPNKYKENDKLDIYGKILVADIWKRDNERLSFYVKNNKFKKYYDIFIVWEMDYKTNKKDVLNKFKELYEQYNWDSCSI